MEIIKIPDKILSSKIPNATVDDVKLGKYSKLVGDMRQTMIEAKGVGLAANQVNQALAVFVIDKKLADENSVPDILFNPEITEYAHEKDELEEGCLSIPEWYRPIQRAKKIKIKAVDEHGQKIKFRARGFLARVIQHETDHLNGLTIKDRFKA